MKKRTAAELKKEIARQIEAGGIARLDVTAAELKTLRPHLGGVIETIPPPKLTAAERRRMRKGAIIEKSGPAYSISRALPGSNTAHRVAVFPAGREPEPKPHRVIECTDIYEAERMAEQIIRAGENYAIAQIDVKETTLRPRVKVYEPNAYLQSRAGRGAFTVGELLRAAAALESKALIAEHMAEERLTAMNRGKEKAADTRRETARRKFEARREKYPATLYDKTSVIEWIAKRTGYSKRAVWDYCKGLK